MMQSNGRCAQIEQNLRDVVRQIEVLMMRGGYVPGYTGDEAAQAHELEEQAKVAAVLQLLCWIRDRLEYARQRIDGGIGDLCELCGLPIDPARLEALVHATCCIACQPHVERRTSRA